ncbi:MAG: HEAT repeat domain-containing protein [Planctomycetales bacterium]|nr:HEAT repeat domain-containing protein [Planctomycetales bacterium]
MLLFVRCCIIISKAAHTFAALCLLFGWVSLACAQVPDPLPPKVADASPDAEAELEAFKVASDLVGSLFAAEPEVANIVAFHVNAQGHLYVCESYRQDNGVTDNRGHDSAWLDDDLAAQTVEDRRAYHLKHLGPDASKYMEQDDRIRLVIDTDGDGRAEESTVFADHFNDLVEGTGAGLLEHNGDVYYTCIPNLWRLRDTDGDRRADQREVLHSGFGVRVAFRGHDLHGLRIGLDGRLYFSIGDRGANVETPHGSLVNVESGSVFRCEFDGSNLEIFATGLRNPQELVFDDHGNLFTGDNNSDSGDQARWVYVVQDGDSGWRMAYQYLPDRGPFNRESLWKPFHAEQPAYIVPPVTNIADGPSGLDYYPGTGFGPEYRGRFFLVDFRGMAGQSGVRSFRADPDGAFFKLVDAEQPIWGMLATDVEFGPDGFMYISDWVNGWTGEGKGRVYRFRSKTHGDSAEVKQVQQLLASQFKGLDANELAALLAHADQRVRLQAQLKLVEAGSTEQLFRVARQSPSQLARLHANWGLAHRLRRAEGSERQQLVSAIRSLWLAELSDEDAEVRARAADLLCELPTVVLDDEARAALRRTLGDTNARVRYFAALTLGKLHDHASLADVTKLVIDNDNHDPVLRHAGALALSRIATPAQLSELAAHDSTALRIAAVVALRRLGSPEVAKFLDDEQPFVVAESARAIHDAPIPAALDALAQRLDVADRLDEETQRRALNANYRLGGPDHAKRLARYATDESRPEVLRLEALTMLGQWASPSPRDRVLGMWRPIAARDAANAAAALRPVIGQLADAPGEFRLIAGRAAAQSGIAEGAPVLAKLVEDKTVAATQRADALRAYADMLSVESTAFVERFLTDDRSEVRAAALEQFGRLDATAALPVLTQASQEGETLARQAAITALGKIQAPAADQAITRLLEQLQQNELPRTVHLETLAAAADRESPQIKQLVAAYEATRDPDSMTDQYRETLEGGNAARGRTIFLEKTAVSCVRCHRIFRQGGEVGPELTRIGADKQRDYLLEAIVDPNKTIAKGFESALIIDTDGRTHVGLIKSESDEEITLIDAEFKLHTIAKSDIDERASSKSAMPADLMTHLSKAELRDLIEFLANQNGRRRGGGPRQEGPL